MHWYCSPSSYPKRVVLGSQITLQRFFFTTTLMWQTICGWPSLYTWIHYFLFLLISLCYITIMVKCCENFCDLRLLCTQMHSLLCEWLWYSCMICFTPTCPWVGPTSIALTNLPLSFYIFYDWDQYTGIAGMFHVTLWIQKEHNTLVP